MSINANDRVIKKIDSFCEPAEKPIAGNISMINAAAAIVRTHQGNDDKANSAAFLYSLPIVSLYVISR